MEQDTGKFRKNTKDQYYTNASVAKKCVDTIRSLLPHADTYQWIEPSAGNGVFLKCLPVGLDAVGIDVEPKSPGIQQGDFLTWCPVSPKKRIFFGNPPFGNQGSLAKSFIQHASLYAESIAFILPRSFVKPSMSRAFPLNFHCIHSREIEKNAFEVNGAEYSVPCVFQIWEKRNTERIVADRIKENGFEYVKSDQPFHIAFRRVGGRAGHCSPFGAGYNTQTHYFLKLNERSLPYLKKIMDTVNLHTFPSNTVGPRSLSKTEVNEVLNQVLATVSS